MTPRKLSVIVVSWNTRELVDRCLLSVREYLSGVLDLEMIVVDNASADGTAEMVATKYTEAVLMVNNSNLGFAAAVNQACARATGAYLLLLNSDAEFLDSDVTRIIERMERFNDIGIATGKMVDTDGNRAPPYYRFPRFLDLIKSYSVDRIRKLGRPLRGKVRRRIEGDDDITMYEVDWVSGGYLIVRADLVQPDGLFDHRIFMYYEDVLLCMRAWQSGYRVVYMDCGAVRHALGASAKKIRIDAVRYSYESSRYYISTVYGDEFLRRYESLNRCIWRVLLALMAVASGLGIKRLVEPKQLLFKRLLRVERKS